MLLILPGLTKSHCISSKCSKCSDDFDSVMTVEPAHAQPLMLHRACKQGASVIRLINDLPAAVSVTHSDLLLTGCHMGFQ